MLRTISLLTLCAGSLAYAAEVTFTAPPSAKKDGEKTVIAFAVSGRTDVEVAVLDAKGGIVRHLAAGLLGGEKAPPPPFKAGLSQTMEWDGKDDFGKAAQGGPYKVRVRAGLHVAFGRFVGGDTCRFGTVNGMATDADGTLYVSGFHGESNQNMITVRAFAPDGAYRRTLLPFPADLKPEQVKGIANYDESLQAWIPRNQNSLNPTFYPWETADANVIAATRTAVTLASGMTVYRFDPRGALIDGPVPMWSPAAKLKCPTWLRIQIAASPDGKYLYYSNVAGTQYQPKSFKDTDPNWPQGRVYRQEIGSGKDPQPFYDLELPDWEKQKFWLPDAWNKRTAAFGLCVDAKGHVYICDLVNQGIVEVGPDGKKISFTKAPWPERVHVDEATGAYYVICRLEQPKDGQVLKKLIKITGRGDAGQVAAEFAIAKHGVGEATALGNSGGKPVLWVGGGGDLLCVRDAGAKLELVETKFKPDPESQPDYNRLCVDPMRDHVYVNTGTNRIWRYDGKTGQGALLKEQEKVFHATDLSVGYDGNLYIRSGDGYSGPLERRDPDLKPVPYPTGTHILSPYVYSRMGVGFSEHGIGVGPDNRCLFIYMYDWNKYCVSAFGGDGKGMPGKYLKGKVNAPDPKTGKRPMPEEVNSAIVGPLPMSNGGLRIDLQGNIYVGMRLSPEAAGIPPGFEKNNAYINWIGCVVKFPPEGGTILNTESKDDQATDGGSRMPVAHNGQKMEVVNALHIYPGIGSFSGSGWGGNGSCCVCRVPRFDVDRYGRLALPNVVTNSVTILDNAGNAILTFGKYGNFDSQFLNPYAEGSAKDQPSVAVPEVPLAWPTGAGFSENHVYVNDTYNRRVVRVDKRYAAEALCDVK